MLKHLFIGLCVFVFFGVFALAQDKPDNNVDEMKIIMKEDLAWNKVCPMDGKPVNQEVSRIEFNQKIYGFCEEKCSEKFKSNPELFSPKLNDDGTKFSIKQESKKIE
jgi:YHS domain-containing protein